MTKERKSIFETRSISWHARKSLNQMRVASSFYALHPDHKVERQLKDLASENVIFDIIRNNSLEKIQKLEIKHITREK